MDRFPVVLYDAVVVVIVVQGVSDKHPSSLCRGYNVSTSVETMKGGILEKIDRVVQSSVQIIFIYCVCVNSHSLSKFSTNGWLEIRK